MPVDTTIQLWPDQAANSDIVKQLVAKKLNIQPSVIGSVVITRKSIDARKGKVKVNLGLRVFRKNEASNQDIFTYKHQDVSTKQEVIIVGSGPAGLFAALRFIELGIKPIIIERGNDVKTRKRDIAQLNRNKSFNPNSNYAFGEGGAGTFSDGKLYTRSRKKGSINRILNLLHIHGAQPEILYEAHPHIGTNVLPGVIASIRKTIEDCGGEFLFNSKVTELVISDNKAKGVKLDDGREFHGKAVVLATGHSARDIYSMLWQQGIRLEAKPFAMGVRVEHPQELIDSIQYHGTKNSKHLPSATYSLVQQVKGRGVYSFCMCPGGYIVPAVSADNEIVVNGMSPSLRNSPWANSGIVVEVNINDLPITQGREALAGLDFQTKIEQLAYMNKDGDGFVAPAQRLTDFVNGRQSSNLPACSYQPGVSSSPIHSWLPEGISVRLQEGFRLFDKKMKGFLTNEALVLAVESRTSSPIRIPRDEVSLQHIQIKGLYPCGEGAGYAGGIVSSALDGERCAESIAQLPGATS
ncbi:MAG: FAD-dependent monooxygenase [Perlabentimonas sp.]